MNVIVSNKQKEIIDNANIDAIKDLNGLFNVDDLISKFKNYFFSKMILDATSVVNFTMPEVLEKLASGIGSDRLIILLPQNPTPPKEFTDKLLSLNINNFSTNIDDILKFIKEPVKNDNANLSFSTSNDFYNESSFNTDGIDNGMVGTSNIVDNNMSVDVDNANLNNNQNLNNDVRFQQNMETSNYGSSLSYSDALNNMNVMDANQELNTTSNAFPMGNNNDMQNVTVEPVQNQINSDDFLVGPAPNMSNQTMPSVQNNQNPIENSLNNSETLSSQETTQVNSTMFIPNNFYNMQELQSVELNKKNVIGIINVTEHAGSTTLVYLLKKALENEFHKTVTAIEVNKNDFIVYQDSKMFSVNDEILKNTIEGINDNVVLVDLNNSTNAACCNEVLYLVEPSIIKINKLIMNNRSVFQALMNRKVILNKSLLSESDVKIFGKEAGVNILMNIPPVNDRINNEIIVNLLKKIDIN